MATNLGTSPQHAERCTAKRARRSTGTCIDYIQHAAATGLYEIRGLGAKRRLPHFDDLVFLAASLSRYPLEGYREKCTHEDGARHALRDEADRARRSRSRSPA